MCRAKILDSQWAEHFVARQLNYCTTYWCTLSILLQSIMFHTIHQIHNYPIAYIPPRPGWRECHQQASLWCRPRACPVRRAACWSSQGTSARLNRAVWTFLQTLAYWAQRQGLGAVREEEMISKRLTYIVLTVHDLLIVHSVLSYW